MQEVFVILAGEVILAQMAVLARMVKDRLGHKEVLEVRVVTSSAILTLEKVELVVE